MNEPVAVLVSSFVAIAVGGLAGHEFFEMKRHRKPGAPGSATFFSLQDLIASERYDEVGNRHRVRGLRRLALAVTIMGVAWVVIGFY